MWESNLSYSWRSDSHEVTVQVERPEAGIQFSTVGHQARASLQSLCFIPQPPAERWKLLDVYRRGNDLVANYSTDLTPEIQTQVYWRLHQVGSNVAVEVIASVQTSQLDSSPGFQLSSELSDGKVTSVSTEDWLADGWFTLYRPNDSDFSYVEFVLPQDIGATVSELEEHETSSTIRHSLFSGQLEKGVIRRTRVCGMLLSRQQDQEAFREFYLSQIQATLPLTT